MPSPTSTLIEILKDIYPLSNQYIDKILPIVKIERFQKLEHLALHNKINKLEYIMIEGVCRNYITNFEGNEATLSFFTKGSVFPPNHIRTSSDRKSLFNIQALSSVIIASFSCDEFALLMQEHSEIEKWGMTVYENELKRRIRKELELITLPAKERLQKFREQFPLLENLVPHPFIASYLGISPVSLSRLRGQI